MSSLKNLPYYYDQQIKRYLLQFMAVFSGLQVEITGTDNKRKKISVPIFYGSVDRVVASIIAGNTQNKPVRLPIMSAHLNSIDMAPELRKGMGTDGFRITTPLGGSVPEDTQVIHFKQAVPYKCQAEVAIYASNQDQHMQIIEQLLLLFDPTVVLQTTDSPFDPTRITSIELTNIRYEENYPMGTDRRVLQTSLDFTFPIYLIPPVNVKQDLINTVKLRLSALTTDDEYQEDIFDGEEPLTIFSFDRVKDKIFDK